MSLLFRNFSRVNAILLLLVAPIVVRFWIEGVGMFERNTLTFNPGWDEMARPVEEFTDVREHQRRLRAKGLEPTIEADQSGTGPGSLMLLDPDGNPVLIDQHVESKA